MRGGAVELDQAGLGLPAILGRLQAGEGVLPVVMAAGQPILAGQMTAAWVGEVAAVLTTVNLESGALRQ